tara:strand:- start:768 stop:1160 length:393 start_codon:yes stop_codon:yes gene_type:complete
MSNRLYCTFTDENSLEDVKRNIQMSYVIMFDKIFVLEDIEHGKLMLTYNVDTANSREEGIISDTILVHRKKQSNTLYTINALNMLIKELNNGVLDKRFPIQWNEYRNCILLVQSEGFNRVNTKIKDIINL